ncbi:unnamed protein product, partial [Candidula unifasciata]
MESEPESDVLSDSGDAIEDLNADKLDPADRVLYEKLKQQERQEREEIERELQEHEEALAFHSNHLRAREKELHLVQERMQQRSERELDLSSNSRPSSNKSSTTPNGITTTPSSMNGCGSTVITTNSGAIVNATDAEKKASIPTSASNNRNTVISNPGSGSSVGMNKTLPDTNSDMNKFLSEDFRAHLHNSASFLSSFQLGHPLAHAHLALGGHLLGRDFKSLDTVNPFHQIMANHSAFPSPPSPIERYPPSSTTPHSPTGSLQLSPSPDDPNGENRSHNWTFEEQFKQLYELSEDPKRKEFLDELFAFMQKR